MRFARTMSVMQLYWSILLLLFYRTDGCLKSGGGGGGSTAKKTTTTTLPPSQKLPCTAQEVHTANCRNGGQCFVAMLNNYRATVCSCPPEWQGKQCERRYVDPNYFGVQEGSTASKVGIGFGVGLGAVLLILVIVFVYFRCFRKPNKMISDRDKNNLNNNPAPQRNTRMPSFTMATIPENGYIQQRPGSTAMNGGYHNATLSSENENTHRLSTLSAVSSNSPALYETAI